MKINSLAIRARSYVPQQLQFDAEEKTFWFFKVNYKSKKR